jgi:hypothetical protein
MLYRIFKLRFDQPHVFTPDELKLHDGSNPEYPTYIAILGKVCALLFAICT